METPRDGHTSGSLQDFWAAVLTDELIRQGVRHVVAGGGSRSTPLVAALTARPEVRLWIHPDERSAAFFALGLSRGSGQPAAVLTTSGSAVGHLVPALMEAYEAGLPLILLTADRPPEHQDVGAPQTTRQVPLHSHLRGFWDAGPPEGRPDRIRHLRTLVHRAVQQALGSPPGPVQLNLPFRKPLEPHTETDFSPLPDPYRPPRATSRHLRPDPDQVAAVQEHLTHVEEGMLLVGADPWSEEDLEAILTLARTLGYPILADPASGLRTRGTCRDGILTGYVFFLQSPRMREALRQTRIWIQIGRLPTASELHAFLHHAPGMHIHLDPHGQWRDFLHRTRHHLWGPLSDLLNALAPFRTPRTSVWWRRWVETGCRLDQALQGCLAEHHTLDEAAVVYHLQRALETYGFLYVASSLPIRELERYLPARFLGRPVMAHRALNGIDGTLSVAAGVAAARGEPGLVLVGDLALLHDINGLMWGKDGVALTVVVLDNGGGGIFHTLPVNAHPDLRNILATPHNVDLVTLAQGYGAEVYTVDTRVELGKRLQRPPDRGIRVVVCRMDRETYPERLHRWLARGRQLLEHQI
ncbi:MAG: 2-succinyl-5-enolpyruvyl-6-hydroxy-3-cyclohexene-1-carboxylic-acid synthase [Candidatus Hydrothermae bacterium]|nr:2-succinyl-5-enolpyruvyl-6-hydroxy-3-cyclohexene-1-carboxylic-acid synthase [Candidatus Hydrothermae bacterium]